MEGSDSLPKTTAQDIPQQANHTQGEALAPTPVEMSHLQPEASSAQPSTTTSEPLTSSPSPEIKPKGPSRTDTTTAMLQSEHPPPPPQSTGPPSSPMSRTFSTAIGPSSDQPVEAVKDADDSGPTLSITLLLTSGARHPFKLDGRYLAKRNVQVPGNDPFNLSVYKLKELILREWREEWETKPSSPSYIRLISFGKLLDDKAPLKDSKFNPDGPNVVHMTIKPQDFVEEDDAKGGKGTFPAGRENENRSPGCRCSVM